MDLHLKTFFSLLTFSTSETKLIPKEALKKWILKLNAKAGARNLNDIKK